MPEPAIGFTASCINTAASTRRRNWHSDSVLPVSGDLPRRLRAVGQPARGKQPFNRRALLLSPVVWVAVELARTRITGFPWDLLGTTQVDNIPLARIATVTGVYGLSFEIMVVNAALAAAYLVQREKRKRLVVATAIAALYLASGTIGSCARQFPRTKRSPGPGKCAHSRRRRLDQGVFQRHLARFEPRSALVHGGASSPRLDGVAGIAGAVLPSDPLFRDAVSNVARQAQHVAADRQHRNSQCQRDARAAHGDL